VKKPAEFNRPRIPISERVITRRANSYISKKVGINIYIYGLTVQNKYRIIEQFFFICAISRIVLPFLSLRINWSGNVVEVMGDRALMFQTARRKRGFIKGRPVVIKGQKPQRRTT